MNAIRIRVLLHHSKTNASQLARHCNVSSQAALNWTKEASEGGCRPREAHLDAIADFFGITRQELEYGPLICISAPEIQVKAVGNLNKKLSIQTAEILISKELSGSPKSLEFRSGMLDRIVYKLSGINNPCSFKPGTCQYDAYMAGRARAEEIISDLKISN